MYIPQKYKNENPDEVKSFLRANSFGILVSWVSGKHWATHIPMELMKDKDGKDYLFGHISKANPQWHQFPESEEVLCIFNGPHGYISPTWYQAEDVPTWDYIAVHVYGTLSVLDSEELYASLDSLVNTYEKTSESPLELKHLSGNTLKQIKGVVGFKVRVKEIQAAYKLSQGRHADHARIIEELEKCSDPSAAALARAIADKAKDSAK